MTEDELSPEERNHLYTSVGISFLIASFAFVAYALYLMHTVSHTGSLQTAWGFLIRIGLPYSIIGPTAFFLSYEVFYPRRVRKSRMFHLKRFTRRTLSLTAVILSFSTVTSISDVLFSRTLGSEAVYPGMLLFVFVSIAVALLWLRRQNSAGSRL
jgi:hypothetical protein